MSLPPPGRDTKPLEALGSAAAGIAHDINNQLTLLVNYLESADVESARLVAGRCSALTASLLSFCRGEILALRPLDPAAFLRDFIAAVRAPAGIVVEPEIPPALPAIHADSLALTRALSNLVANAMEAMNGKGTLRIAALPGRIAIEDSGPGIAPENLARIFEPFFSTKGTRGTGLGLAIVRDIMRRHGGAVTVRSEAAHGARFELEFPP